MTDLENGFAKLVDLLSHKSRTCDLENRMRKIVDLFPDGVCDWNWDEYLAYLRDGELPERTKAVS